MNASFTSIACEGCRKYPWCNTLQFGNPPKNRYCYENPTNFDNITASPETLAKFIVNPENHFCSHGGCPFNMNGERLCDDKYESCEECATAWLKQKAETKTED